MTNKTTRPSERLSSCISQAKETDSVQEAACDVLGNEYSRVIVLRISLALYIPVFDRSNDMGLIGCPQLKFSLVTSA